MMAERQKVDVNIMGDDHDVGAKPNRRPSILITGFGPFQDIPVNPTTIMIQELPGYLQSAPEKWKNNLYHHIQNYIVMDTSVANVKKRMNEIYAEANVDIILHLGVHYKAEGFQIEKCAYNDATFRIPDQQGYQPSEVQIIETQKLGQCNTTLFDVEELVAKQKTTFPNIITNLSVDPGRFVCNYTYCYSLYHLSEETTTTMTTTSDSGTSDKEKTKCLFLHVPKFEVVSKSQQLEYVTNLIQKLIEQC